MKPRPAFNTVTDPEALPTAIWALVHGLACLHLDGEFDTSTPTAVSGRVRAAVLAVLAVSDATSPTPGSLYHAEIRERVLAAESPPASGADRSGSRPCSAAGASGTRDCYSGPTDR